MDFELVNKIKSLETFTTEFLSVVKLTMFDGSAGWGQMSPYNADITSRVFHRQVAPHVLNIGFSSFKELEDLVLAKEHKFPGSYLLRALSGLDTALWDWLGKREEKPVSALIGGRLVPLRVYGSSMKRQIQPSAEADRLCILRDQYGFDAFKFRVGAECGRGIDEWLGRTEEIVKVVPKALGDNIDKLVDANSCYSVSQAIKIGKMLEDNGICHFEEPCPYWLPDHTKIVADSLEIDVAGGEQDCDFRIWDQAIKNKIVNIVQPDLMYLGGFTRALRVSKLANEYDLACTPHAANLSLVTICTMHFLDVIPNPGKYLELSIERDDYYPWQKDLFLGNPFQVNNGKVKIPTEPGWGVQFNPSWLEKTAYNISSS